MGSLLGTRVDREGRTNSTLASLLNLPIVLPSFPFFRYFLSRPLITFTLIHAPSFGNLTQGTSSPVGPSPSTFGMGVLDLLCVTTDPDATTFFGLAYAEDYSNTTVANPQYAVLVKSNTNPSSPGDLNWSVVSMFDGSKLNGYPGSVNSVDTSCTMNALGVFTMFGRYISTASFAGTKVPFGIRYNPAGTMDPKVGYNGRGAWSNVTIKDGFNWSGPFDRYVLGYTNSSVDAMLVHASLSDTNNTITMATLNESTMTLVPMAIWSIVSQSLYVLVNKQTSFYTS